MSTKCAPLLADLFLFSYEVEYIEKLVQENYNTCCGLQLDRLIDILTTVTFTLILMQYIPVSLK